MSNLTISQREILFLRTKILQKYCDITGDNFDDYCRKLTGTLKYYEEIAFVVVDELLHEQKLNDYFSILTEKSRLLFVKQFREGAMDNKRLARECANSISANVIRKLIFNGLGTGEQAYKNNFVYACYYFINSDRSEFLRSKPLKSIPTSLSGNSGTIKPDKVYGIDTGRKNDQSLGEKEHKPSLKLVPIDGENMRITTRDPILLKDAINKLNRDKLDPGNNTITSKTQAEINYVEGKWMIENFSRLETTFFQVLRPIELKKGDVIVMGSLKFRIDDE
jgi:hypothetical protein